MLIKGWIGDLEPPAVLLDEGSVVVLLPMNHRWNDQLRVISPIHRDHSDA